jgi:hypothetical protein
MSSAGSEISKIRAYRLAQHFRKESRDITQKILQDLLYLLSPRVAGHKTSSATFIVYEAIGFLGALDINSMLYIFDTKMVQYDPVQIRPIPKIMGNRFLSRVKGAACG